MTQKDKLFGRIIAWTVLVCIVAVVGVFYVHLSLQQRQLEKEIIYRKAQKMVTQERREQVRNYQKRFERQRANQQYNRGSVVAVQLED